MSSPPPNIPPSTAKPAPVKPEIIRQLFDEAYGDVAKLPDRAEAEVLQSLPTDSVRLFFELADEAIVDPSRDNPFAVERKIFEINSEELSAELSRLQKLGESALLSLRDSSQQQKAGQLPGILATMHVGATRVKPAPIRSRFRAAAIDASVILVIAVATATFLTWFSASQLRTSLLSGDPTAIVSLLSLAAAILLPTAVAYYFQMGAKSYGYRRLLLEIVNTKTGNPITTRTTRIRAWLVPISLLSWLSPKRDLLWVDRLSGSTVRRNYALAAKKLRRA